MKNYAYLDSAMIMHVVKDEKTAKDYCEHGNIVPTEIPCGGGYPIVGNDEIIVYSETEMKFDAHGKLIKDAEKKYPHISALYKVCRG